MDRCFINLMLEHVRKANQIDGVFRKEAWMDMIASFNAKFGYSYDVDILKNRHKTLKRQYIAIKHLLQQDGFSWDDTRKMVTADDSVWHEYIKGHSDARQFMKRPMTNYKDMRVICGDGSIDETDCVSPQCLEPQNNVQIGNSHGAGRCSQSPAESGEDQIGDVMDSNAKAEGSNKRQSEIHLGSSHLKKSRSEEDKMASAIREMATVVSSLTEKNKEEKNDNPNLASIENVIAAVQTLPEMDEELILDACDFLEDDIKAKTFMALDAKLRKKWLLRKLRPDF